LQLKPAIGGFGAQAAIQVFGVAGVAIGRGAVGELQLPLQASFYLLKKLRIRFGIELGRDGNGHLAFGINAALQAINTHIHKWAAAS
jgi:hypothetical protein